MDALDAYDALRLAEQLHERLAAACAAVENKRVIRQEKTWLAAARDLLSADQEQARALVEQARMLPELLEVRQEFAGGLQQIWVDALEKLVAGITFHSGSRAPLIETLFPHLKFPNLRKAGRDAVMQYQADLEKRQKLSYVQRMLTDEAFAFALPCLAGIQQAYGEWLTSFSSDTMPDQQAAPIRKDLIALGERAELLSRQAKLLAEAALLPIKGAFDEYGLAVKPRKRSKSKKSEVAEDGGLEAPAEANPAAADEPVAVAPEAAAPVAAEPGQAPEAAAEFAPVEATPKKPRRKKADPETAPQA